MGKIGPFGLIRRNGLGFKATSYPFLEEVPTGQVPYGGGEDNEGWLRGARRE